MEIVQVSRRLHVLFLLSPISVHSFNGKFVKIAKDYSVFQSNKEIFNLNNLISKTDSTDQKKPLITEGPLTHN